ncbi:MAG: signal peptidase I [Candidatus Acidiferrales bacterium]
MNEEATPTPEAAIEETQQTNEVAHPARYPGQSKSSLREYAESLLVTILLALYATTFIVQAFKIPSQSMEPTLMVGDHLLVNKFIFGGRGHWFEKILPYRAVERGDVIVFKFPFDDHPHYVKRVIGLPGERIKIIDRQVYINGLRLGEPYAVHKPYPTDPFGDDFPPTDRYFLNGGLRPEWAGEILKHVVKGELIVPPDHYFVMGDNRESSWDSRYWGFVHRDAIMGRPVVVYWSVSASSEDYDNRGLVSTILGIADALRHLPSRTRWNRLFHEVH